jgi:hypothetical protein
VTDDDDFGQGFPHLNEIAVWLLALPFLLVHAAALYVGSAARWLRRPPNGDHYSPWMP